jgi:hypothetical protein
VGPVVPFIPAIAGAIGGIFGGKKATQAAQQRSPEEQTALTGAQGAGTALGTQGATSFGTGTGLIQSGQTSLAAPTNYFSQLLSGNRALQSQAIAAPRAAIQDTYSGAERGLERSGVQGAARDVAKADLAKQQAGQISSLITGVQPGAAAAMTQIGQTSIGQGTSLTGQGSAATASSGNVFQNLLQQGSANRQYGRSEGQNFGSGFGGLIFDALKGFKGGGNTNTSMPGTRLGPLALPSVGG